jgi:hypothetical protein
MCCLVVCVCVCVCREWGQPFRLIGGLVFLFDISLFCCIVVIVDFMLANCDLHLLYNHVTLHCSAARGNIPTFRSSAEWIGHGSCANGFQPRCTLRCDGQSRQPRVRITTAGSSFCLWQCPLCRDECVFLVQCSAVRHGLGGCRIRRFQLRLFSTQPARQCGMWCGACLVVSA